MEWERIAERIAKDLTSRNEANPLDGMRKPKATKIVNNLMSKAAGSGLYSDEYWKGIKNVWNAMDKNGIPYVLTKSEYQHDKNNPMPTSKRWEFEIPFVNERGKNQKLFGWLVAAGGGSIEDPLDKYDVTGAVS